MVPVPRLEPPVLAAEKADESIDAISKVNFNGCTFLIIGYGSIARGLLPLIIRHIQLRPEQVVIFTRIEDQEHTTKAAEVYGVRTMFGEITPSQEKSEEILASVGLQKGDFILNLTSNVDSNVVMRIANKLGVLYLDTTADAFFGHPDRETSEDCDYWGPGDPVCWRDSQYAIRERMLDLKTEFGSDSPTALSSHGANPGMVSHFVKQALVNMARDTGIYLAEPTTQADWAALAQQLGIKTIQISEYDSQRRSKLRQPREFVSTWSVDSFISEARSNSEFGWGTHEKSVPRDGLRPVKGSQVAMLLNRTAEEVVMRSWSPLRGAFRGNCGAHCESMSIASYLSVWDENDDLQYRPSVMFVYRPCDDAVLSLQDLAGSEFKDPDIKTILAPEEIVDGVDELGVLLGGNEKGAYWYGSQLSAKRAASLVDCNQATTLQVTASALAGIIWVLQNPQCGVVEPDEIPYRDMLDIIEPYVAPIVGTYSSWTPLEGCERQWVPRDVDKEDPWQLQNIRV